MSQEIITKIKSKGNEWFRNILYASSLRKHTAPTINKLILCYHGIDTAGSTQFSSKFISRDYFEKQLIYFKKNFNLVSMADFFDLKDERQDKLNVALTFDDGYRNNFKYVLPLLEKYEVPAAFFITGIRRTDAPMLWGDFFDLATYFSTEPIIYDQDVFIKNRKGKYIRKADQKLLKKLFHESDFDTKKKIASVFPDSSLHFQKNIRYNDYWQQMNGSEISQLSKSKWVTIGSHGYYHNDLARMPLQDAMAELSSSRKYLENIIQKEVVDLAFPYGNYTDKLLEECIEMGFKRILSLEYMSDKRANEFCDRFGMNPYMSWNNQLHFLLKGGYI